MPPAIARTVRQRKLIASLRKHRETADLSETAAARQLGFSQSKLSRLEKGVVRPKPADVIAMLDLYGVPSPERDALLTLTRDVDRRGWWTQYDDLFSASFVAVEDEAEKITTWETVYVPGLLQIEDYARAVISHSHAADPQGLHRRVVARMTRSMILRRPQPPHLHAIVGEAALRQQVGGPDVMRRQLIALREASHRDNITFQVVPFTADAHPGMEGPATLFRFAEDVELDVVHTEGPGGTVYLEGTEQVQRIRVGLRNVADAALSPEATRDLLESLTR
ncbi:helix-turn-helix domain-containing protein [Actinomadura viridis]|uniref:helix-turn-helix domain-containing protein n=1 Tax=Actinomadura viridis TaxID=58110 RepID=UPI0036B1E41B